MLGLGVARGHSPEGRMEGGRRLGVGVTVLRSDFEGGLQKKTDRRDIAW